MIAWDKLEPIELAQILHIRPDLRESAYRAIGLKSNGELIRQGVSSPKEEECSYR